MVARKERHEPDFGRLERFDGSLVKDQQGFSRASQRHTRENQMITLDESVAWRKMSQMWLVD